MKMIGIKRLWFGEPITQDITKENAATLVPQLVSAMKEVKNIHGDTWGYTQDDHTITNYINALTGKPYHREIDSEGAKTIAFTIGDQQLEEKAELQGGTVDGGVWKSPDTPKVIYKAFVAQAKSGNFVIFTHASVSGKVDTQEKALGLGVAAVANDNPNEGVADEYWIDVAKTPITIPAKASAAQASVEK